MKRSKLLDFIWLGISLVTTTLLIIIFFRKSFWSKGMYEIHFVDAFFSFTPILLFCILFFGLSFVTFYIRCFRSRFSSKSSNVILLISGIILIGCLLLINIGSPSFSVGYTIYPPLSHLGESEINAPELPKQYSRGVLEYTLLTITLAINLLVVNAAYKIGQSMINRNEANSGNNK